MEQVREVLLVGGVYDKYTIPPVPKNVNLIFVKFRSVTVYLDDSSVDELNTGVFAREDWADAIVQGYEPYERDEVDVSYVIFNSTTLHDLLAAEAA